MQLGRRYSQLNIIKQQKITQIPPHPPFPKGGILYGVIFQRGPQGVIGVTLYSRTTPNPPLQKGGRGDFSACPLRVLKIQLTVS